MSTGRPWGKELYVGFLLLLLSFLYLSQLNTTPIARQEPRKAAQEVPAAFLKAAQKAAASAKKLL